MSVTASGVKLGDGWSGKGGFPGFGVGKEESLKGKDVKIVFVPYFYHGNRGGRGHMRVGFQKL